MTDTAHYDRVLLDRLVFFSDAIFAIAITLLVIEIQVPHFPHGYSDAELANALLANVSSYIGFLVSFFVIGRFWLGHHRIFGHVVRADDTLIWRNLLFLMTIAFMPFPTAIISYFASSRVGIGFYTAWLVVAGLLNLRVILAITRGSPLDAGVDDTMRRLWVRRAWSPVAVGGLAFAVGMVQPLWGLVPLLASPLILRLFAWTGRGKALPAA